MVTPDFRAQLAEYVLDIEAYRPGNSVDVLVDGDQTYGAMLEAIAAARESVLLEMYIFASDDAGWRFADALGERARAGIEVAVLYDSFGSLGASQGLFQRMRDLGVRVIEYLPIGRGLPFARLRVRDHRKIVVVDGDTAFIGGLNIGNAYAGPKWAGGQWRDTCTRLRGPVVGDITDLFAEQWRAAGGQPLRARARAGPIEPKGSAHCAILATAGRDRRRRRSLRRAYLHAIHQARRRICITNPYFVPTGGMQRALRKACERGVEVVVLLAGNNDVPVVKYAGRALYARLLRWGVHVYEWHERVLHAKTATVDGVWATVGSFNLDHLSAGNNLEANANIVDRDVARELERIFDDDVSRSRRIHLSDWKRRRWTSRLLEWAAYQLRFWL